MRLFLCEKPLLAQLVEIYNEYGGNIIAVSEVPKDQTARYGIVDPGEDDGRIATVRGLVENRRYELAYAGIPRWLDAPPDPATPSAGITAPFRLPFSPLNLAVALILGLIILIPALRWLRKRARPKK